MMTQLFLDDEDMALIVELLRSEHNDLPSELRRTDNPGVHDTLKARMARVTDLLHRLEVEPARVAAR